MSDKITQVRVGKNLIGLRGLEEAFEQVMEQTWETREQAQEDFFARVAAQNYLPPTSRDAYRQALDREFCRLKGEEVAPPAPGGLEIKLLGLGCAGCQQFYQKVVNILAAKKIEASLQYITEPALLKDYKVRALPALIINDQVVLAGRIPQPGELESLIVAAPQQTGPKG
jgi:hypothetical protein